MIHMLEAIPLLAKKVYANGDFVYKCNVEGDFSWFHGCEEIYHKDKKFYQGLFHGGEIK